jgi:hypothetical protein
MQIAVHEGTLGIGQILAVPFPQHETIHHSWLRKLSSRGRVGSLDSKPEYDKSARQRHLRGCVGLCHHAALLSAQWFGCRNGIYGPVVETASPAYDRREAEGKQT